MSQRCRKLLLATWACLSSGVGPLFSATLTAKFSYDFTGKALCSQPSMVTCLDHFEVGTLNAGAYLNLFTIPIPGTPSGVTGITGSLVINSVPSALTVLIVGKDTSGNRVTSDPALGTVSVQVLSTTIDCGSATDQYFTGGLAFTVTTPGATGDLTIRYGTFSYLIPAEGKYKVTLFLRETGTISQSGQRSFSVKANDIVVLDRFDLYNASKFAPTYRSFDAYSVEGSIKLDFSTNLRSAVVASIELSPLQ